MYHGKTLLGVGFAKFTTEEMARLSMAAVAAAFGAFPIPIVAATIGTNTAPSSAGSAKRPFFAAPIQLNKCCELMSCRRAISATGTPGIERLGDDPPLLLRRPAPAATYPGANVHPPARKPRVAYSVGHMCETFPPNQREDCNIPRASIKV